MNDDDYIVIETANLLSLTMEVNAKIKQGWYPMAGVSVSSNPAAGYNIYCQAMLRARV